MKLNWNLLAFIGCMLCAVAFSMVVVHGCESEQAAFPEASQDVAGPAPPQGKEPWARVSDDDWIVTQRVVREDNGVTITYETVVPRVPARIDTLLGLFVDLEPCNGAGERKFEVYKQNGILHVKWFLTNRGTAWPEDELCMTYMITGPFSHWPEPPYCYGPWWWLMRVPYPCHGPHCGSSISIGFCQAHPGHYTAYVYMDSGSEIEETDETNNVLFAEFDWPLAQ